MHEPVPPSFLAVLRWTYGLVPLLAGLDKFFNLLANWSTYLSPPIAALLPVSPATFMHLVGVVEILAGLAVLSRRWTRLGATAVLVWLTLIAGNLVFAGFYDVAVRDLTMAVGAWALARLTALNEEAARSGSSRPAAAA